MNVLPGAGSGYPGESGILLRDKEVHGSWSTHRCPVKPLNDRCLAPLPDGWLALTDEGLVEIDGEGEHRLLGPIELREETGEEPPGERGQKRGPALYTSRDGRFVAVVADYGQYGTVVDLPNWTTVLDLDRAGSDNEYTRYPLAFIGSGDTAKLVAGTAWNKLDIFALPSGELLTERDTEPPDSVKDEPREHSLDYFQGGLIVSPSERSLVVDGWVWHPVGIPLIVDLAAWQGGDTHAAEHGQGVTDTREWFWDQPIAWVGDETIAVQCLGNDEEKTLDGVELYDASTARRTGMFAGPAGPMWGRGNLLYVRAEAGLEVWDPAEGARIGLLEGFAPTAHNAATGSFAELDGEQVRVWTPTPDTDEDHTGR